jgi:protein SCO1/2
VRARLVLGAVIVVVAAGCGSTSKQAAMPASTFEGTELSGAAPGFALHDQDGKLVRLTSLRGTPVLVTFIYTHCPDVCPIIATNLDTALRKLGPSRARVLAVSVDPRRDTPAAARAFLRSRAVLPQFRFLVGTERELARVWHAYHIAVQPGPKGTVTHSAYTFLVDGKGKERVLYGAQVKPAQVVHDVRALG